MPVLDPGARGALKTIAAFEAAKGLLALGSALGLLGLLHRDLHHLALELIGHFGLDPHAHYPSVLVAAVDRINATPVHTIVLVALAYVATRWTEAWGLWHDRAWGEWFGALSGALYVPLEVRHLLHHATWQGALVLAVNLAVIAYLVWRLWRRRRAASAAA